MKKDSLDLAIGKFLDSLGIGRVPIRLDLKTFEWRQYHGDHDQKSHGNWADGGGEKFYSPLGRAVAGAKQKSAPASDWIAILSKGITKDELAATGVIEHLKSKGKEQVSKEDLEKYLSEHKVEITPVVLGKGDSKYGQYVLPGGSNYREMLLTLPVAGGDYDPTPTEWDQVSSDQQEQTKDKWMESNRDSYVENEINNYWENSAYEDMRYQVWGLDKAREKAAEKFIDVLEENGVDLVKSGLMDKNGEYNVDDFLTGEAWKGGGSDEFEYKSGHPMKDNSRLASDEFFSKLVNENGESLLSVPVPGQGTLPGISEPGPISQQATAQAILVGMEAAVKDIVDNPSDYIDEVPDYITGDSVDEYMEESWNSMSDREKFQEAEIYFAGRWDESDEIPEREGVFQSGHYKQGNIVAHVRMDDRVDADGKKVLFLEEIQSDWAQQGRSRGFASGQKITKEDAEKLGYSVYLTQSNLGTDKYFQRDPADSQRNQPISTNTGFDTEADAWSDLIGRIERGEADKIPSAPFVTDTKAWVGLAMNHAIAEAVDKGYDAIAWTTGAQQADRYNLAQHVQSIKWYDPTGKVTNPVGVREINIALPNARLDIDMSVGQDGRVLASTQSDLTGNLLSDVIGKEMAQKIMGAESGELAGEGLKIGGSGMKSFYDQIVPNVAGKLIRKSDPAAKIEKLKMVFAKLRGMGELRNQGDDWETKEQQGFYITPKMREAIKKGIALFELDDDAREYHGDHDQKSHGNWADGEKVSPEKFIEARDKSTRGQYLSHITPDDIKDHKLILMHDGKVGAAVSPDGDIQNVFNNGGPKGAGLDALAEGIDAGGYTLDCYDDFLPDLYSQMGFVETGRMKFDREYAPKDWDYENKGEPDVVFMAWKGYDGGRAASIARAKDKTKQSWKDHEKSSKYYDGKDWDQAKADSRGAGVSRKHGEAHGPRAYGTAGKPLYRPGETAWPDPGLAYHLEGQHEQSDHGNWAGEREVSKAALQKHLVDFKQDRPLTGPGTSSIPEIVKGATTIRYMDTPGIATMHTLMGIPRPSLDTDPGEYTKARDSLFNQQPLLNVPFDKMVFTQPRVNVDELNKIPQEFQRKPVQVVKWRDKYYLMNGHHRVVGNYVNGGKDVPARVLDLDAKRFFRMGEWYEYHLAGTEYDHDQQTHAGGRDAESVSELAKSNDPKTLLKMTDKLMVDKGVAEEFAVIQDRLDRGKQTKAEYFTGRPPSQPGGKWGAGEYIPSRAALHDDIVNGTLADTTPVDAPELVIMGGISGSGKSSAKKDMDLKNYVMIDADEVRAQLRPEYKGWNAALTQDETDDITDRLFYEAARTRRNISYDATMKSYDKFKGIIERYKNLGYKIRLAYVDAPLDVAMGRAIDRYKGSGRYVSPYYIASQDHLNRKSFEKLKELADDWADYDASGKTIVLKDRKK